MVESTKCKFTIDFNSIDKDYALKNYQFLDINGTVKNEEIKTFYISDKYFDNGCSIRVCFRLFSSDSTQERKFYFDLFYGENYATCFFNYDGKLLEINFKNQNETILELVNKKKIIKYDTNNTSNRKRFLLINYSGAILKFNDKIFNLMDFFPPNPNFYLQNSIKLTVYNIEKNYILSNFINFKENPNEYLDSYNKYYPLINGLQEDIESLINSKKKSNIKRKLLKKIKIFIPKVNLNLTKKKIQEILSKEEFLIFEIYKSLKKILLNFLSEWDNDYNLLKELYDYYLIIVNKIKNDLTIKLYQKIFLLNQFSLTSEKFKFIKDFKNSKFNYFLFSCAEPNSVLNLTYNFFIKFVSNLSEEHEVFDRLIELDGEIGYFKGESYFCYNMENLYEVKTYLKQKIPEIITTFYNENKDNSAFIDPFTGYITINFNSLEIFKDINIIKSLDEKNLTKGKKYASKLITFLLHEVPGHIKFAFGNACNNNSPSKFINDFNEICQLVSEDYKSDDNQKIKILTNNNKFDSGSFFELLYGKIGKYYVSQILDSLNDYGKLVDRVDLLLENLDLFNEYIKMHFLAYILKIDLDNYLSLSIEDEVNALKDFIKKKNIDYEDLLNYSIDEEDEENEEDNNEELNDNNDLSKEEQNLKDKNNYNKSNEKKELKDKILSSFVLRKLLKKYPHLKTKYFYYKKTEEKKYDFKDTMLRYLFFNTVNIRDNYKKIQDDPYLTEDIKNEYYRILDSILSCG